MLSIDPKEATAAQIYNFMSNAVAPRPIAFVSTVDEDGNRNLSPFSFFGLFSANPPVLAFSPLRRLRDNTTKHTLHNVEATKECVISVVTYDIGPQVSLASTEYPDGVDEFEKAGFTPMPATKVKPALVGESPVNYECKVIDIIALGTEGGAGNLVLCEVVAIHMKDEILTDNLIDEDKLDLISRYGGNYYGRITDNSMFEMEKPLRTMGIGFDNLPDSIRKSEILTGSDLALIANVDAVPEFDENELNELRGQITTPKSTEESHQLIKEVLANDGTTQAWKCIELFQNI